jgi:pyruvate dehydrogenase E2 component (dihydrolipoamide acetyltransferase)
MPTSVIMPALELAQETGKVLRWLKQAGAVVSRGEPIVEIETDKVTVEVEAPAAGVLGAVSAAEGDVIPVGTTIAQIFAPGEAGATAAPAARAAGGSAPAVAAPIKAEAAASTAGAPSGVKASPLARKLAEQHGVDIAQIRTASGRVEKADVLAFVDAQRAGNGDTAVAVVASRLAPASPKARRLAAERGVDLHVVRGSGPGGAVLAADVPAQRTAPAATGVSNIWRIMAERMTQSWTSAPHFYLVREVNASRLMTWRERAGKTGGARITYTDLLVRLVAAALRAHPRVNVSWQDGTLVSHADVNIGLAVALDDGLVVPVLHRADTLTLAEIAARREDIVARAQSAKLRPADIQGGTFTISNLGMYGVDAFNAIVNPPQAAILAVGRIAERVVPVNGQPAVQPMLVLTLSCDHRAVDGARGAQFLGALADLVEEPLALIV